MPSSSYALLLPLFQHAWGTSFADLRDPGEVPIEPAALRAWEAERPAAGATLAELAPAIGGQLQGWLWSRNQFLAIDAAAEAELLRSVARALAGLAQPEGAVAALALHRRELYDFVRARLGPQPREVSCAEYSPELQLEVLGLTSVPLTGPLLDVGCGAGAKLVRFFVAGGLAAHGVDREAPLDVATRADWLSFDYAQQAWGTVLSHQGFTLHFLHHHHAQGDAAYAYARVYMSILRALAPAGRFAYAPGLPFLEGLLDASTYRVERVRFADALRVPALVAIEKDTGLDLSYAAHVTRI